MDADKFIENHNHKFSGSDLISETLHNWKSSRRKRFEHIIERVVEVKNLELEKHDQTKRKSKTFSEMMEERGERGRTRSKLQSLASYNEDEANDLSDLGIGTSSARGKSSISENCEVHSIVSEPPEVEHISKPNQDNHSIDRISLLGSYETSSTAPNTSPDRDEYTYEGAIEDYKSRVSKASSASSYKKKEFDKKLLHINEYHDDNDIETPMVTVKKEDLPQIDISKMRELFEKQEVTEVSPIQNHEQNEKKRIPQGFANVRSINDRLCSLEKKPAECYSEEQQIATAEILPGEIYSIKERLECLKQSNSVNPKPNINRVVAEVEAFPPLKDRLSSLQNAVTKKEIVKKRVVLVDEYQHEILKNEDMARRQLETSKVDNVIVEKAPSDDSGINKTDEKIYQEPATTEDDDVIVPMTTPILSKREEKLPSSASSPKTYANDDEVCEVNHAQNLLKMFKLAFNDESDVIKEIINSNQVEIELDEVSPYVKCGTPVVKLRENVHKPVNVNDFVQSQNAPKAPQIGQVEIKENFKKSPSVVENEEKIISNEVSVVDQIDEKSKHLDLQTIQNIPPNCPRSFESDLNVVVNIENCQHKSLPCSENSLELSNIENSVSSTKQMCAPSSDFLKSPASLSCSSQKFQNPVRPVNCETHDLQNNSSPIPCEISSMSNERSESFPKFISVMSKVERLNNLSAISQKSTKNPICENVSISHLNPCLGLKKVSSPQNNGRIEIFNSKRMPGKPNSPVLNSALSKYHQQSALSEIINSLEPPQHKIAEESVAKTNFQIIQETRENPSKSPKEHAINKTKNIDNPTKAVETKSIALPLNIGKKTLQPINPLPLESCVDILQSFLTAERSINRSPSESNSHPSDCFIRQESVVELPYSKLDVEDLPDDPNCIPTPCISVDCDEKIVRESIKPQAQAFVRDSISSADDSSPSSDNRISVIFKSTPESPTPNKSSLMEIANRMGSPIAARRDPLVRQKPVSEKPCLKLDVKDLPDPNFIRTECFEVDINSCRTNNSPLTPPTPGLALHKTNAEVLKKTCNELSTSPPLSPVLGRRNAENTNFMIARKEVVETKIKVTTTNDAEAQPAPAVPISAPPSESLGSPKLKPKSTQNSKPKNIFEFLKKNFQSKSDVVSEPDADGFEPISVDNSMFYVPSDVISADIPIRSNDASPATPSSTNGVNIEITKIITSDSIVGQTDSDLNLTDEIKDILG